MENKYALWKHLKEKCRYYKRSMGGDIYFGYVKGITLQFEDSALTEAVLVSRGAQIRWEKKPICLSRGLAQRMSRGDM